MLNVLTVLSLYSLCSTCSRDGPGRGSEKKAGTTDTAPVHSDYAEGELLATGITVTVY